MTLYDLQQEVLRLSATDRWQLVQWILSLLKRDSFMSAISPLACPEPQTYALLDLAGSLPPEDAAQMQQAVEDCNQVDINEW